MPDSVTLGNLASNNTVGELTDAQMVSTVSSFSPPSSSRELTSPSRLLRLSQGADTPAATGTMTDLVEIGNARDKVLSLKLDQVRPSPLRVPSLSRKILVRES